MSAVQVKAVEPDAVVVDKHGKQERIPFGTCIWTTGIRMHPLAERVADVSDVSCSFSKCIWCLLSGVHVYRLLFPLLSLQFLSAGSA